MSLFRHSAFRNPQSEIGRSDIRHPTSDIVRCSAIGSFAALLFLLAAAPTLAGELGVAGDLYATRCGGNNVLQFDGVTGELVGLFSSEFLGGNGNYCSGLAWLPNGNLATAADDGLGGTLNQIVELDGQSGELLGVFASGGDLDWVLGIVIGPNGNLFATSCDLPHYGKVVEFDSASGALIGTFAVVPPIWGEDCAWGLAFGGPNGNLFVGNFGFSDPLNEFDGTTGAFIRQWSVANLYGNALLRYPIFGPNGNLIVSGSAAVHEFDPATGEYAGEFVTIPTLGSMPTQFISGGAVFGGPNNDLVAVGMEFDIKANDEKLRLRRFDGIVANLDRGVFSAAPEIENNQVSSLVYKPMYDPFPQPQLSGLSVNAGDGCGIGNVVTVTIGGTDLLPNFAHVRLSDRVNPDIVARIVGGTRPWITPSEVIVEFDLTGVAAGTYDLVFNYPDGGPSDTLAAAFTVNACPAPTVTAVDPPQPTNCPPFVAPLTTTLTLTGTGFVDGLLSHPTVTLSRAGEDDIVATNVTVGTSTTLTAAFDLWKAAPGPWDMSVINPDGQVATLVAAITVADCQPALAGLAPGAADNCDVLVGATVTGSGFIRGTQLTLTKAGEPDIRGINIDYVDENQLVAEFGLVGVAPGLWSLVANNPDGQTMTLPDALEVTAAACPDPALRPVFTKIYEEGDPLPGQPVGDSAGGTAVIDRSGSVFFNVRFIGGVGRSQVFRQDVNGIVERLYFPGQVIDGVPSSSGLGLHDWWVSEDGHVLMRELDAWYRVGPGTPIHVLLRTGTPIPDLPGLREFRFLGIIATSTVGIGGQFCLGVRLRGVGTSSGNDSAILGAFGGAFALVLREGDPDPTVGVGEVVQFNDTLIFPLGPRAMNAAGWLLTHTDVFNTSVLRVGPGHDLRPVVWSGLAAHGVPGAAYDFVWDQRAAHAQLSDHGEIAYFARLNDARYGVWLGSRDNPNPVAVQGSTAPGVPGAVFHIDLEFVDTLNRFVPTVDTSLNNRGELALRALLSGPGVTTSNDVGLWLGTSAADLTLMIREGDPAFVGRSGGLFEPRTPILNDRGDLLVLGDLSTGGNTLWLHDHRSGRWTRLLETGDTVLGRFVNDFKVTGFGGFGLPSQTPGGTPAPWNGGPGYASGLNDAGSVIVLVNSATGVPSENDEFEAIYRIDLVPVICPADLDGNGEVGAFDLALLLGSWGPCDGCPADLDDSGAVGAFDLALLLGAWGPCE